MEVILEINDNNQWVINNEICEFQGETLREMMDYMSRNDYLYKWTHANGEIHYFTANNTGG